MKRSAAAFVCALLATACAGSGGRQGDDSEFVVDFDAMLDGRGEYNDVNGSVRAVASLGATAVTISLSGTEPGAVHPWHIHYGRCGSGGSVVGPERDYPLLTADAEGSDRVTTTIPVQLDDATRYHVNVHLSQERQEVIVACSDLLD